MTYYAGSARTDHTSLLNFRQGEALNLHIWSLAVHTGMSLIDYLDSFVGDSVNPCASA
jgi:hypothetical protein